MENTPASNFKKKPGILLISALIFILIFAFMGMGIDFDQYQNHQALNIPAWYFFIIFGVNLLTFAAAALIFFQRKVGVILLPLALTAHFFLHIYFLNSYLYSDITALFFFVGLGLLAIIPEWKYYR